MAEMRQPDPVDILILGAGWTSTFLIPLLQSLKITYAATTTTGRDGTIPFKFNPSSTSEEENLHQYKALPFAKTVLITFPVSGRGQSRKLVENYQSVHGGRAQNWIQLGSTGIFSAKEWNDFESPWDRENGRGVAEEELLGLGVCGAVVLNLAGLYDGEGRNPRNWVRRVAKSKADVSKKQAVHLIHGRDVARAILACHESFSKVEGRRWIITDMFVYDWWTLMMDWGGRLEDETDLRTAVFELMEETGVKALPRDTDRLGRRLDSREFWKRAGILPECGRMN
ncbi:hypothetical protein FKW77_010650 [Venturia effusa]|uniref:Uncharacterized protein n=1 Tax=Venturia effusa TaxID=50376 RepID=A0A517KY31_9PEZI|nr:hypothetical protein FKW77_010650 [Venturia effusa]